MVQNPIDGFSLGLTFETVVSAGDGVIQRTSETITIGGENGKATAVRAGIQIPHQDNRPHGCHVFQAPADQLSAASLDLGFEIEMGVDYRQLSIFSDERT